MSVWNNICVSSAFCVFSIGAFAAPIEDETERGLMEFQSVCVGYDGRNEDIAKSMQEGNYEKIDTEHPFYSLLQGEESAWVLSYEPIVTLTSFREGACKVVFRSADLDMIESFLRATPGFLIEEEKHRMAEREIYALDFEEKVGAMLVETFIDGSGFVSITYHPIRQILRSGDKELVIDILEALQ